MRRYFLLSIITLILQSTELKVASYNVENLFDDVQNGTEYREFIPNTHNWTKEILNKKLEHTTRVICDLNPDIIGLEEIENSRALKLLQESLNRAGCRYPFSAITNKRGSAIQVALLSKIRISQKRDIKVSNSPADRDILEADLKTEPKLKIFVNHWRSKRAPESQRVKYAKALVERINKMSKTKEYIILGDFNSDYNECVSISQKNNNTSGMCGIDIVLHTYENGRLIKLRDKNIIAPFYNYNLWSELSPHKRWSHDFYGKKSAIDSIIISPNLNDKSGWFYKKGSFMVFKKRYLFQKKKKNLLNRWVYRHSKHMGKGYSDHLPIYAIFSNNKPEKLKHESILDKFWKLFIPQDKSQNQNKHKVNSIKKITLNELVKIKFLKESVILKDVCVIFKRGDMGVIKSYPNSKTITLYRSAEGLEEGKCYNLRVFKKKKYYGLDEITDLDIVKEKKSIDINNYISEFNSSLMAYDKSNIGEIVKNIEGVYKDRYITVNGDRYRLFVKEKKRGLLRKNSHLHIKRAQISIYKGEKELVVYSLEDISKEN